MKAENDSIRIFKVDCAAEQLICIKFKISENHPRFKVIINGESSDYYGSHKANTIFKYMKTKAGLISKELNTLEDAEKFINNEEHSIVGFFSSYETKLATEYKKQSETLSLRYRLAHTTNADLINKYNFQDKIVIFQPPILQNQIESPTHAFDISTEIPISIRRYVDENFHGLVGHRTDENLNEFKKPLVTVYYNIDFNQNYFETLYVRNRILKVAKKLKDELLDINFCISNAKDFYFDIKRLDSSHQPYSMPRDTKFVGARGVNDEVFKMEEEYT